MTPGRFHLTLTSAGRPVIQGWWQLEATTLMHGYAHELSDRQRAWIEGRADVPWWVDEIPDIIDPEAQQPPVGEYSLSSRGPVVGGGQ